MNIKQAKQIKLETLLEQLDHKPDRTAGEDLWYRSPFRDEQSASFKLNRTKNIWYDFGIGLGGDVIGFVKELYNLQDVSASLQKLGEINGESRLSSDPQLLSSTSARLASEAPDELRITEIGPIKHPALLSYLQRRAIPADLASEYLQEVHYQRGDKTYFGLALANDTGLQTGLGFEIRNQHFKGSLGPKDIRTVPGNGDVVNLYEGIFDYLSHRSLTTDYKIDATAVILNSTAMKERALAKVHSIRPSQVNLYFDSDNAGKSLAEFFRDALPEVTVRDKSGLYSGWKDLNEYHASRSTLSRLSQRLQQTNHHLQKEGPAI